MRRLTLSFDNGPDPRVTPAVLDLLAARGLRASFFVCGRQAADPGCRPLLERAREEGHRLGSHTLTHSVELGATRDPDAPRREIEEGHAALGALADPERLFRPYGAGGVLGPRLLSPAAVELLCAGGFSCVLWSSVPRDWEDPRGWPERALADVARRTWTLLVLHDIATGAMDALPGFLDRIAEEDVQVVAELPPDCVPIRGGRVVGSLEGLVAPDGAHRA